MLYSRLSGSSTGVLLREIPNECSDRFALFFRKDRTGLIAFILPVFSTLSGKRGKGGRFECADGSRSGLGSEKQTSKKAAIRLDYRAVSVVYIGGRLVIRQGRARRAHWPEGLASLNALRGRHWIPALRPLPSRAALPVATQVGGGT